MQFGRSLVTILATAVLMAAAADAAIPSAAVSARTSSALQAKVQDAYIVKLRDGTQANSFIAERPSFANKEGPRHTYDLGKFQGFASKLSAQEVEELKKDGRVEYVQPQKIYRISGQQANPPSYGLARISQRKLAPGAPYTFPDNAGEGADIWVIDTGVVANHTDFEGRATLAKSFVEGEAETDLNGHGTHVAGTTASKTFGVAKKAKVFGVKVLNGEGSGTDADVLAGIQFVAKNARPGKSVVNMSLGGDKSKALDDAVAAAVDAGVAFIVAAGNERADACNGSPSGAAKAFGVAASDKTDRQASFSNFGKCVSIYAPGVGITSLWTGKDGATNTISGTSMASPHVAGVAALYLATGSFKTVDALYKALVDNATPNVITGATAGTPNKLVFNQIEGSTPSPDPSPKPSPDPSPEPKPSPEPSPEPGQPSSPSPKPNPTPEPEPSPEPGQPGSPSPKPEPNPEPELPGSPSPKPEPEPSPEPELPGSPSPNPKPEPEPSS